jgi:predicted nucleotidyltransferase
MESALIHERIQEMVRRIVAGFDPEMVVLFGSHARGTAGPDSDVDLLIVLRLQAPRREVATQIDLALLDLAVSKDILVVTPEEVERDREQIGTLIHPALRDGKVLYERVA